MKVSGPRQYCLADHIVAAARAANVGTSPIVPSYKGTGKGHKVTWTFTLRPAGDAYRRLGFDGKRRVNAVCYHGHLAFFRALYRLAPDAIVQTGMATYRSVEELERDATALADRNVGSEYRPQRYADLCTCSEYNVSGVLPTWQADGTAVYG